MPLLSDTMKEGKIVAWHKKVGDKVKSDDVLADVETDKATMEVMPYADGTVLYLGVKEGEGVPVNGIIAIVGKEGTDIEPYLNEAPPSSGGDKAENKQPAAASPKAENGNSGGGSPQQQQPESSSDSGSDERVKASPLAKKLAQDK